MVNSLLLTVNWLKELLGSTRVYAVNAPEKFDPEDGVGYVVTMSAGSAHAEMPITTARVQIRCIAKSYDYLSAHLADARVFDALHQKTNVTRSEGRVLNCLCELWGQDITDPDTEWAETLAVYQAQMIELDQPDTVDIVFINGVELGSSIYINGVFLSDDQILINGIDI